MTLLGVIGYEGHFSHLLGGEDVPWPQDPAAQHDSALGFLRQPGDADTGKPSLPGGKILLGETVAIPAFHFHRRCRKRHSGNQQGTAGQTSNVFHNSIPPEKRFPQVLFASTGKNIPGKPVRGHSQTEKM